MNISDEINSLIEGIKNNRTDGASELARQAVTVMKTAAETSRAESTRDFLLEQKEVGKRLIAARRTMAPIPNIITRLLRDIIREDRGEDLETTRKKTIKKAADLFQDSLNAVSLIAQYTSGLVNDRERILTHSYSSTVVAALKEIADSGKNIEVAVTRSGPSRAGVRTARELSLHGILVNFIDDTAVGLFITHASIVVVGADRICADGKVINGTGTYPLAIACEKNKVPFYVLCETLKLDFSMNSDRVDLEEKDPSEVIEPGQLPPEVKIANPYFDITPLELVTAVVTENGVLTADKLFSV